MMGSFFAVLGRWGGRRPRHATAPPVEHVSPKHGRRRNRGSRPRIVRLSGVRPGVVPLDVLVTGVPLSAPRYTA
jgi:hypothetical protein